MGRRSRGGAAAVTAVFTMVGGFAGVAYADIIQSTIKILAAR
jgi:Na+/proline symporter